MKSRAGTEPALVLHVVSAVDDIERHAGKSRRNGLGSLPFFLTFAVVVVAVKGYAVGGDKIRDGSVTVPVLCENLVVGNRVPQLIEVGYYPFVRVYGVELISAAVCGVQGYGCNSSQLLYVLVYSSCTSLHIQPASGLYLHVSVQLKFLSPHYSDIRRPFCRAADNRKNLIEGLIPVRLTITIT